MLFSAQTRLPTCMLLHLIISATRIVFLLPSSVALLMLLINLMSISLVSITRRQALSFAMCCALSIQRLPQRSKVLFLRALLTRRLQSHIHGKLSFLATANFLMKCASQMHNFGPSLLAAASLDIWRCFVIFAIC